MIINSIYDVTFSLNGFELLNTKTASGFTATIVEDIMSGFPICQVTFTSSMEFLNNHPIVDGSIMRFSINNKIYNTKEDYTFRVSNVTAIPNGQLVLFSIDGFLDFYEFFRNANKYATFGLSSEVFKSVAEANNLQYDIDQTNDKQIWIPSEINVCTWLNLIAEHGWIDHTSCMIWFIDKFKKLSYKDISNAFYTNKNKKVFKFGAINASDAKKSVYRYKTLNFNMNTGLENVKSGYNGNSHHFDLLSYHEITQNANKVRSITEIININKELSQGLSEGFMEIDTGNFHPNYFMAENQNKRIRGTLSTFASLGCEYTMPIRLGEIVTLEPVSSGTQSLLIKSLNCQYVVSSLKTNINEVSVNMEVTLCTQGYNGRSQETY